MKNKHRETFAQHAAQKQRKIRRQWVGLQYRTCMFFTKKRSIFKILVFLKSTEGLDLTGGFDSILSYEYGFEVMGISFPGQSELRGPGQV